MDKLGVNIENAEPFIVMEIVQAPAIGTITRKGFVDGWKAQKYAEDMAFLPPSRSLVD